MLLNQLPILQIGILLLIWSRDFVFGNLFLRTLLFFNNFQINNTTLILLNFWLLVYKIGCFFWWEITQIVQQKHQVSMHDNQHHQKNSHDLLTSYLLQPATEFTDWDTAIMCEWDHKDLFLMDLPLLGINFSNLNVVLEWKCEFRFNKEKTFCDQYDDFQNR